MRVISSDTYRQHRKAMLAKIHIAMNSARVCIKCTSITWFTPCWRCAGETREIAEVDYRRFLKEVTGKNSCKDMSLAELDKVIHRIKAEGYRFTQTMTLEERYRKGMEGMKKKLQEEAQRVFGEGWRQRLRGFCRTHFGVDDVMFLSNDRDIRQVFAFLRKVEKGG